MGKRGQERIRWGPFTVVWQWHRLSQNLRLIHPEEEEERTHLSFQYQKGKWHRSPSRRISKNRNPSIPHVSAIYTVVGATYKVILFFQSSCSLIGPRGPQVKTTSGFLRRIGGFSISLKILGILSLYRTLMWIRTEWNDDCETWLCLH